MAIQLDSGTLLIGVATTLAIAYWLRILEYKRKDDVHRLQSPPNAHWLWGNEKEGLVDRSCSDAWNEWAETLGPSPNDADSTGPGGAYRIKGALWYGDILVPTDPEIISHVVSRNVYTGKYSKSPNFIPLFERLVGRSIVWAEGKDHKRMAKALGGCFTTERVRGMQDVVNESVSKFSAMLRTHVLSSRDTASKVSKPQEGTMINMMGWPSRATLDIIGRVCFDYDFECGESAAAKDILRLWSDQAEMGMTFTGFLAPLLYRSSSIVNSLLPLEIKRTQEATKMRIRTLASDLVRAELASIAAVQADAQGVVTDANEKQSFFEDKTLGRQKDSKNMLSYLIRASVKNNQEIDVSELLDHVVTFIVAGEETTGTVVSFIIDALARDQKRQDKLRAELTAAGFVHGSSKEPTFDELMDPKALPYLDAVTKEGLRVFAPAAQTERTALQDDVIPLKTPIVAADGKVLDSIRVRKGQMIFISWLAINTNARTWGPDGTKFIPERWFPEPETPEMPAKVPHATLGGWQHLGTFSEGPRICLGYRLAVFEVKALLLALVRDFKFDPVDQVPVLSPTSSTDNNASRTPTGEMMDVKLQKHFAGLAYPHLVNGEKAGMSGIWLPVKVRLADDTE